MNNIAYCSIYPGIGIARVGDSPTEFFFGPEVPGTASDPDGGFKDKAGRVKRQSARFRLYAHDAQGNVLKEITAADADITWTVHLANKKGSWFQFQGAAAEAEARRTGQDLPLRNADVQNTPANLAARNALEIDPGPRSITGVGAAGDPYRFDSGTFLSVPVPLGELRTDEAGRLFVLGGFGHSESVKPDNPIVEYANNDSWHDDTSDGPVTARVVLKGGVEVPVKQTGWVIVAPPDFAPSADNVVTLYEIMEEVAAGQGWIQRPAPLSFTRDIYPILRRVVNYQWVNAEALRGHGPGKPGNFLEQLDTLGDNSAQNQPARQGVFDRLRNPTPATPSEAVAQANYLFMPQLSGDEGYITEGDPTTWLTVLPSQYKMLAQWAAGNFAADWPGTAPVPPAFSQITLRDQPAALDRAALEHCVGGAFFPGIEMTYIARDPTLYAAPFRLRPDLAPGDITKRMAVPWQADFYECQSHWWPAQRPDDVITEAEYEAVLNDFSAQSKEQSFDLTNLLFERSSWARGIGDRIRYTGDALNAVLQNGTRGDNDLAVSWSQLGFVVPRTTPNGGTVLIETERDPYAGLKDRDYFYIMMNLDAFPDFLPKAKKLAEDFLGRAADLQNAPTVDDELRFFEYTPRAFNARLQQIYNDLVDAADAFDPSEPDNIFRTPADVVERIRQLAPFNQTDGGWLRNVTQAGPISEVHALLFSIWMDEVGGGFPELNHSNLYTDLLHSVGLYLEDINTRAYADNPDILDSAYTAPLFELVISQFSDNFFPEILGMTLQLEWEVVELKITIKIFERLGFNAQFYKMHVGIDNAISGHGGKVRRGVEIYLDQVRAESGEEAVQQQWRRIWNGYIAFRTTGTLGQDLANLLANPPSLRRQMLAMIARKRPYARLNHGDRKLGPNRLNDWFDDPSGLLDELVKSGMIIPGNPDASPFFNLLKFTGPMYKVFTDTEIKLWTDWTRSLTTAPPPPPPADPAAAMAALIDAMRERQQGTPGHDANQLTGPDPSRPGQQATQPVSWWFTQPTAAFMHTLAIAQNGWIVKNDPANSRFLTVLLSGGNSMAATLGAPIAALGGKTGRQVVIDWITAGCPLPAAPPAHVVRAALPGRVPRLSLWSPLSTFATHLRGTILGNGTVH
jgi:hypothetical protein